MASRGPGRLRSANASEGELSEEEPLQQQRREQAQKHGNHEQQPNAHPALPLTLALVWVGFATLPFMRLHLRLL